MNNKKKSQLLKCAEKIAIEDLFTPELALVSSVVKFLPGDRIMEPGESVSSLMILVDGRALVSSLSENGKLVVLAKVEPPQMLGDIEYMNNTHTLHYVHAETSMTVIRIPVSALKKFIPDSISFYRLICSNLIRKLYKSSNEYSKTLLYPAQNRLANYLLNNLDENNCVTMKAKQVAELLGITPRHLSSLITDFCNQNILIRQKSKQLKILDKESLKKFSTLTPV